MRFVTHYTMKEHDTARRLTFSLRSEGKLLSEQPDAATVHITKVSGGAAVVRTLQPDEDGNSWYYDIQDVDFTDLVAGDHDVEIIGVKNGKQMAYPTKGYAKLTIQKRLA